MTRLIDCTVSDLISVARGCYQRSLLRGESNWSGSDLRGRAREYSAHYRDSRSGLIDRLRARGYRVEVSRGERGRREVEIRPCLTAAECAEVLA
jgi:hypothetical protein